MFHTSRNLRKVPNATDGRLGQQNQGGYDISALSASVTACLRVLMGEKPPALPPTAAGYRASKYPHIPLVCFGPCRPASLIHFCQGFFCTSDLGQASKIEMLLFAGKLLGVAVVSLKILM
jgi:hypothetical protein